MEGLPLCGAVISNEDCWPIITISPKGTSWTDGLQQLQPFNDGPLLLVRRYDDPQRQATRRAVCQQQEHPASVAVNIACQKTA